jgi:CRP/FNR family transcriptional regulator
VATDSTEVLRTVKAAALFSALDDGAAAGLVDRCLTRRVGAGQIICTPGEKAERFFVILAGRVKVFKLSARGDEQILHLYGAGETFGEAAMWAGGAYPAYAEAVEDATLLLVGRKQLRAAVADNPDLAVGMLVGLSRKLHEFADLIEKLSLKEVPARLAGVLLAEAAAAGAPAFRLRQTKRQLAAQIGTVAETLSRALAKLKAGGLVEVHGAKITILDADGLRVVAEGE